jgi:hypothetical protein
MKLASFTVLRFFTCAALLFSVLATQAQDKKADPTGTWAWTMQGRGGQGGGGGGGEPREITLKIKKEGDKYVGTMTSPGRGGQTAETKIDNIKVDGDNVNFSVTREFQGNSFTSKYSGKVSGDTLTGKIESPGRDGGEARSRDWTAKRKKE